jgi:uncharacterized Fe-S center protein
MMDEEVHFISAQIQEVSREATLLRRFRALLDRLRIEEAFGDRDKIAVKFHVGGPDSYTTVHPQFIRAIVDRFKDRENFLYAVDEHRAVRTAWQRGYTQETLGAPIYPISGVVDKYLVTHRIDDSPYFEEIKVAGTVAHADGLIVVSHAKGHASCGFGAAIKNLGIGCVAQETRNHIHTFEGHENWRLERLAAAERPHEALAEGVDDGRHFSAALARSAVEVAGCIDPGKVLCLNVALNVHPYCDCWGLSSPGMVPDIGLFLGRDPAAVDEATLEAVGGAPVIDGALPGFLADRAVVEPDERHLLHRLHHKDPWHAIRVYRELSAAGSGATVSVKE